MNLKEIRQQLGLSQSLMARRLNISKSYYSELESGRKRLTKKMEDSIKEKCFYKSDRTTRLTASFDWVSLHFRTTNAQEVVSEILHLDLEAFTLQDYARYHYPFYLTYDAINLYWNNKDAKQGVTIEMSGSACRAFEAQLVDEQRDWYDFFNDCLLYENKLRNEHTELPKQEAFFNVTRLDLALDEAYSEAGNYEIQSLYNRFEAGLVVYKKRGYRGISEGGKNKGFTLYIGAKSSPLFFRFYAKDAERAKELGTTVEWIHQLYGIKNRYEIVMHGEVADQFVRDYLSEAFNPAERGVQIINGNLTVFSDFEGHLDEDWLEVMQSTKAYRFQMQPKQADLEKTWRWAEKVVFPTLKVLKQADEQRFRWYLKHAQIPKRYEHLLKKRDTGHTEMPQDDENQETGKFLETD